MASWVRHTACVAFLSCASVGVVRANHGSRPADAQARPAARDRVAVLPPEVRLRKLHLVRPDLIPYPIDIEVVC